VRGHDDESSLLDETRDERLRQSGSLLGIGSGGELVE
jgi:hypothetical protein